MPNIDELFNKYSSNLINPEEDEFLMDRQQFAQAIAEVISLPVEAEVSQPSEPSFGQWIDVNKKLPAEFEHVITYAVGDDDPSYGYIRKIDGEDVYWVDLGLKGELTTDVDYWMKMPLPKP